MADIRTPRPQVQSTARPQAPKVVARPVDMGAHIRPSDDDTDLSGLVQGLQSFNPALQRFAAIKEAEDTTAAKQAGEAAAQRANVGELPLDLQPTPDMGLKGTYQSIGRNAFRQGIVERTAEQVKSDMLSAYGEEKDKPGFNVDAFINEHRGSAMGGLENDMAGQMGKSLTAFEAGIRRDYEGVRLKRLDIQREQNISAALSNHITGDDPNEVAQKYFTDVLPIIEGQGKTKAEAAQFLLRRLTVLSDSAGGRPELFDTLMTEKGPGGFTVFDANTALQPAIQAAKHHAMVQRDKVIHDAAQEGNALSLKDLDERVAKDPYSVTFDDLLGKLGKFDVFQTDDQVVGYWRHIMKTRGDKSGQDNLLGMARLGQLYLAEEKDQKNIMGALTGKVVGGLSDAISNGDVSGVAALTDSLVSAHHTAGSTVPSGPIERMFKFIGQGVPTGDKPTPIFQAAAEVYRALEKSPQLRDAYFDEKSRKVMSSYLQSLEGQAEPAAAYRAAYETVGPEAERRAEAFKQTPEYKEKLGKVSKWVTGSSFVPRMLGGNGRPENSGELMGEAQQYAVDLLKRNPSMTEAEAMASTEAWAARTFVLDPTTRTTVKIPPGTSPELAQKAIESYMVKQKKDLGLDKRDDGWNLMLIPDNRQQGTYRLHTGFNGAPVHMVGEVKMQEVIEGHRRDTLWLPEDAAVLKGADLAIKAGTPVNPQGLPQAIAKARQLKVQPELVKQLEAYELKSVSTALTMRPKTETTPDTAALFKDTRQLKVDHKQTAASAQRLLDTSMGGSTGLAASLITMGESVVLRAYDDPARGAGKNIGMGYNLNANKANAEKDLKASGVPAERIPGILAGTAELSPEQAERLVLVAVGRYESLAQGQVNSFQPRMWEKLQPQQRAVLTDIAYQTGNVAQFQKALTALVSGDMDSFREHSKVHYTDRSGNKVEDKRRNALRDSMLAGSAYWQAVLQKQAGIPSTPLDAVALNNQSK